jgi:hypothetical protein
VKADPATDGDPFLAHQLGHAIRQILGPFGKLPRQTYGVVAVPSYAEKSPLEHH